jgi:GTPase SAR1 family protein
VLLILAGNKCDLNEKRQVSVEEGQEYAQRMNLLFFETSAKTGTNIKTLFNELAKKLTGIETNPINTNDEKAGGFVLGADPAAEEGGAAGDGAAKTGKKKKKKKGCC